MNMRLPAAVTATAALAAAMPNQANALSQEFTNRQAQSESRPDHVKKCLGWWTQMYTDHGVPKNVEFISPTNATVDVNLIDMRDPSEDPMAKECEDVNPINRRVRVFVTQGQNVNVDTTILDSTAEPDNGAPIHRALPVLKPLKDGPYMVTFTAVAESPNDRATNGAETHSEYQDRTFTTSATPPPNNPNTPVAPAPTNPSSPNTAGSAKPKEAIKPLNETPEQLQTRFEACLDAYASFPTTDINRRKKGIQQLSFRLLKNSVNRVQLKTNPLNMRDTKEFTDIYCNDFRIGREVVGQVVLGDRVVGSRRLIGSKNGNPVGAKYDKGKPITKTFKTKRLDTGENISTRLLVKAQGRNPLTGRLETEGPKTIKSEETLRIGKAN